MTGTIVFWNSHQSFIAESSARCLYWRVIYGTLYNVNLYIYYYLQFSGSCYFSLIFIFHIDIVYECIVLRCIVENKLTYLLTWAFRVNLILVLILSDYRGPIYMGSNMTPWVLQGFKI